VKGQTRGFCSLSGQSRSHRIVSHPEAFVARRASEREKEIFVFDHERVHGQTIIVYWRLETAVAVDVLALRFFSLLTE
jgi:hypothetical protein